MRDIYKELGIKSINHRSESAYDPNILFSKYDICYINTTLYESGEEMTSKRYQRPSIKFLWAYEVLKEWGYIYDEGYIEKGFLEKSYAFIHDIIGVYIRLNYFHDNLFKINYSLVDTHKNSYVSIEDQESMCKFIDSHIENKILNGECKELMREVKLKRLLNENIRS